MLSSGFARGYEIGQRMKYSKQQAELEKQQADAKVKLIDMQLQQAQLAMEQVNKQRAENERIAQLVQGGGAAMPMAPGLPQGAEPPPGGMPQGALAEGPSGEMPQPPSMPAMGQGAGGAMEQISRAMAAAALRQGKFADASKILEPYSKTPETAKPESPLGKLYADRASAIAQAKTPEQKERVAQIFDAAIEQESQPKDMTSRTFNAMVASGQDPLTAYATLKQLDRAPTSADIAMRAAEGDPTAQLAFKYLTTKARAGATQVNTGQGGEKIEFGKIDPGFQREIQRDSQGRIVNVREVPIPGSKAEQEFMGVEEKKGRIASEKERAGGRMAQDINRALALVNKGTALPGALGIRKGAGKLFPEGPAGQLNTMLDSLKAGISITELNAMRQSSPTGGALGNVTEGEHALLAQQLGSLDINQKPEELETNLRRAWNTFMDMTHGKQEQIDALSQAGRLPPERAKELKQRYALPFDEFGRPVEVQVAPPKKAQQKATQPKGTSGTASMGDTPEQAQIRQELKAAGMSDAAIDAMIGRK